MPKAIDLTGQEFGYLTVLERDYDPPVKNPQNAYWKCRCSRCGNIISVASNNLRKKKGGTKSCGCLRQEIGERTMKDLSNQRFGKLVAIYPTEKRVCTSVVWHCICDCGNYRDVEADALLKGKAMSCGCIRSNGEVIIQKILTENNIQFIKEKTFEDLFNSETKRPFRFDFYLPQYNRLIEFDGKQHFEEIASGSWANGTTLQERQKRDKIKNQYTIQNGIDLIRISYWEKDNLNLELLLGNKYLIKEEKE